MGFRERLKLPKFQIYYPSTSDRPLKSEFSLDFQPFQLLFLGLWFWTERGLDQGQVFQKLSTKLVILAILVSATVWCGRNYKALKHLATVNRHRALSIQTLQAFSAAASDPQTKDAVLLEATRAVFANVPTGYIESGTGDSDLKIVEVARSILPKPPST